MNRFGWIYPKVFAHRGAGTLAPENTLAAMKVGKNLGFKAVEFDVMLTQDNVPILMHDTILGRTVKGEGSIANRTWNELSGCDAGDWFLVDGRAEFSGEPIPLLEDTLIFCRDNHLIMNVEIKPVEGYESETGRVVAEHVSDFFARYRDEMYPPLFSSFSPVALAGVVTT